jgi:hypothetical protein
VTPLLISRPPGYYQERRLVIQALERAGNNQTQAARLLRITRDTLRYKKFSLHNKKRSGSLNEPDPYMTELGPGGVGPSAGAANR